MAKRKRDITDRDKARLLAEGLHEYLSRIGRKGGKAAAGKGGRKRWADIPAAERSKIMKAVRRGKKSS
jgi:hypothetical protein